MSRRSTRSQRASYASATAWIDANGTKVGYEISFARYFYKPTKLRSLDEIKAEMKGDSLVELVIRGCGA